MLYNAFLQALREIKRNFMRSLLTATGIVIGIASVIAMVNIGKGASLSITNSVQALGSNTLYVMLGQQQGPTGMTFTAKPFSLDDIHLIKASIFSLKAISPVESVSLMTQYKENSYQTNIKGIDNDYFIIQNWELAQGRYFEKSELRTGQNSCIIGQTVKRKLFPNTQELIGKKVRLNTFSCVVIGLLKAKGTNTFGRDQDDMIAVPIKLFQRRISGNEEVHMIMAAVKKRVPIEEAKLQIERLLRERRHIKPDMEDDFTVGSMTALLDTISKITSVLTLMLGAVAAISLLVGGIGIMNIMLVSVTERTREIGIRMAVGAMSKDILVQFLIESLVLSGLGGLVGIVLGLTITVTVSHALDITLIIDPGITLIALLFSMFIGIFFGIIPARKAANMNPIEALRFE